MENGEGVFEDRLRILEQHDEENGKLLKGIQIGQVAVAAVAGASPVAAGPAREKKVLDRAVPDEIKKLVSEWPKYLLRMENPMKTYFQKAKLSLGNDDILQVVFLKTLV